MTQGTLETPGPVTLSTWWLRDISVPGFSAGCSVVLGFETLCKFVLTMLFHGLLRFPRKASRENQMGAVEDEPEERAAGHGGPERAGRQRGGLWTLSEGRAAPDSHTVGWPGLLLRRWMPRGCPEPGRGPGAGVVSGAWRSGVG